MKRIWWTWYTWDIRHWFWIPRVTEWAKGGKDTRVLHWLGGSVEWVKR